MKQPEDQRPKISKSKYELTLSEFPLFLLSKDVKKLDAIRYEDTITGKNGEIVKRRWAVYPDSKLGFGAASTFSTLFEIFQIWKGNNFDSQYIQFGSIYNILKRKGLQPNNRAYALIKRDLSCLVGIKIEAENAFWDNERKAYVDMVFHLFDVLYLYKEFSLGQASLPFATIKASDVLYGSILKNSLLTADFDSKFFHSLGPVEQRLALYLSKVFRSQVIHKRNMLDLARQFPIYTQQTRNIKQKLKEASAGLISKGFKLLESFDFEKGADGKTELIIFKRRGSLGQFTDNNNLKTKSGFQKEEFEINLLVEDILAVCQDEKSTGFYYKVACLLANDIIYRALSEVKEVRDLGEIKKNKGSLFTSLIKKYAKEQGIDL